MPDDIKARVQHQFGAAAEDYATSDVHAHGESLGVLVELINPHLDWHVLDVATGAGHTARTFAPYVEHVTATDITGAMLTKTAAGFQIESSRRLSKEFEFHEWADRQSVSVADKERLLEMMHEIPDELQPLFAPRWADNTLYFSLWEVVIVATCE